VEESALAVVPSRTMKHLDTLKLLDKILGILYIIGAVIALLAAIWPLIFIGSGEVSAIIVAVVGAGFAALSLLVIGILHIKAGGMILQGRGRILQTAAALGQVRPPRLQGRQRPRGNGRLRRRNRRDAQLK